MKENLFTDLPIIDQATLSLITLIEVVKDNGVPPLPHAWEFPNVKGYAQERKDYPVAYLDLFFHRNSGKPFIRDNVKLFSVHVDYFDHLNPSSFDTFDFSFNYYRRNKVFDAWYLDKNADIYVSYNENLVVPVFDYDKKTDSEIFTKVHFLTTPTNGYSSVMMEIGSIYNTKHFKLNTNTLRYLLEKESVFDAPIELDYLVDLFNRFMFFLISQDYYVTPNKIHSKEETYLLHEVGELTGGIRAILNYLDLNYVNYYVNSNILGDVYCYFY